MNNAATTNVLPSFDVESVEINPSGRLALRVFALVNGNRFEFARLSSGSQVEVYDFPASWDGVARFVGYASTVQGEMVETVARKWHGPVVTESLASQICAVRRHVADIRAGKYAGGAR